MRRRRVMPSGRTVLGGILVASAAVIVFGAALANASTHGRPYVVAARPLAAGSILGPGDTTTESLRLPTGTRAGAFESEAALIGRVVAVAVTPGELLEASMLAPAGDHPHLRPVSVPVDPASLVGLGAGSPVDVLAAPANASASGGASPVSVVVRGASVMALSRGGSGLLSGTTSQAVVTLGVSDLAEAEAVLQAAHDGTVSLVQAEPSDGVGPGPSTPAPGPPAVTAPTTPAG